MKPQGVAIIAVAVLLTGIWGFLQISKRISSHDSLGPLDEEVEKVITAEIDDEDYISARTFHARDLIVALEEEMETLEPGDQHYDRYRLAQILLKIRHGQMFEGMLEAGAYAERTGKEALLLYEIARMTRGHKLLGNSHYYFYNLTAGAYLQEGKDSLLSYQIADCVNEGCLAESIIPWGLSEEDKKAISEKPLTSVPVHDRDWIDFKLSFIQGPGWLLLVNQNNMEYLEKKKNVESYLMLQGHYASPLVNNPEKTIHYSEKLIEARTERPDLFYAKILRNALEAYYQKGEYEKMIEAYDKVGHINEFLYTSINQLYTAAAYWHLGRKAKARELYQKGLDRSIVFEWEKGTDGEYDGNNLPGDLEIFLYHAAFPLREVFVEDKTAAEWALPPLEDKLYKEQMKTRDSWKFDKMYEYGDIPSFDKEEE